MKVMDKKSSREKLYKEYFAPGIESILAKYEIALEGLRKDIKAEVARLDRSIKHALGLENERIN